MSKVLSIKASPRAERSHSVVVANALVASYKKSRPDDAVVTIGRFQGDQPAFDGIALQAKYTNRFASLCNRMKEEMMFKRNLLSAILLFLLIFSITVPLDAFAGKKSEINTTWGKVAIKGYDTVAYFTMGEPVKGKKEYETTWKDAKWRFATAEHRDLFTADPGKYAPQYGGY